MIYTKEQQLAIDTIDKNLQIIACAGSGKTQVVSQRIVNILKSKGDISPSNIIAFTYTEKAAAELKTRILKLCKNQIGDIKGLAEMYIGTIHSWCLNIIQDNVYEFQKYSVLDEIKLKLFIDKYYNDIGMAEVGMNRYTDTNFFVSIMTILREAEIDPEEELPIKWNNSLISYESKLKSHSYFDFTMIMTEVVNHLLNDDNFRQNIFSSLKYLIVDEYQDVNPIQEQLITELSKSGANICVVGDDDQTIYQWRGGDVRYIQSFRERHENVKYIKLEDNFRSTPGIIDVALKCINNNINRLPKIMNATGHQQYDIDDIIYNQYDDLDDELNFIADTIKDVRGKTFKDTAERNERGIDYSDCVILLRTWSKASPIMNKLTDKEIPFIVGGVNELFRRPEVRAARAIYEYLEDTIEDETLYLYWGAVSESVDQNLINNAIDYLNKVKPRVDTYFGSFSLQKIFWTFLEKANLREETFIDESHSGIIGNEINEVIFYNLGMFSQIINDYETIHFKDKPIFKLKGFLKFLQFSAEGYYPEGWLSNSYKTPNAVQIMTIFQSKGLEFPVVFIPSLNRNYLPIKRPGGKQIWHFLDKKWIKDQYRYETSIEDERRLMYVAITRCQKYLFVTRAKENRLYKVESIFGKEISNSDYLISNKRLTYHDRETLTPTPRADSTSILLNFSVLKSFFDCPYKFKLISLYGFVQPFNEFMGYGNSVHNILMDLHRQHLDGEEIDLSKTDELVDRHLHLPYASTEVFQRTLERTLHVTSDYLKENINEFDNIQFAEKEIQIDLDDGIMVNGRMDLIKKKDLAGKEITTIVDFKSTKDAQSKEISMEQLSLYALGYQDLTGETADFLQIFNLDEDSNSKSTQKLENSRLDEIRSRIIDSANDIRANNLEKTCISEICKTCFHKQLCSGIKE